MALRPGSYFCPSRFSFSASEMLSFSIDPEIVSFLWANSPPQLPSDIDLALRYRLPRSSHLFQIFLSSDSSIEETTFLSTLQCTVVTTGILVVVGVSSVYTFKLLQWLRQSLKESSSVLQTVKSLIVNLSQPLILQWRRRFRDNMTSAVGNNNAGNDTAKPQQQQLFKRPSDLQLLANGSPRFGKLFRSSRENSLERRLLTKARTPLADCDIASGEEDIAEIQGQYFGPAVATSTFIELMHSSPEDSPIHASSPTKSLRSSPGRRGKRANYEGDESSC